MKPIFYERLKITFLPVKSFFIFVSIILFSFECASAQNSQEKEYAKIGRFFLSFHYPLKYKKDCKSAFFSIQLVIDKKGKVINNISSKNIPMELVDSIKGIACLNVNWGNLIPLKEDKNILLIPVYYIANDCSLRVEDRKYTSYFRNIFSFPKSNAFVISDCSILEPIVIEFYTQTIIETLLPENYLKADSPQLMLLNR